MADDLTVRFAGDATSLNATLAQARQSLAAFAPGATVAAAASVGALGVSMGQAKQSGDGLLGTLRDLAVVGAAGIYIVKETAKAVELAGEATLFLAETINKVPDVLVAGSEAFGRYYTNAAIAARSQQLFENSTASFRIAVGSAIIGLHQMIDAVVLQGQGTTNAALQAIAAAGNYNALADAVASAGDKIGSVTDVMDGFISSLAEIPDMSKDAAVAIEATIAAIPNYSVDANNLIITWLQEVSRNATEAQVNVKALTSTFTAPEGGTTLANMLISSVDFSNLDTAKTRLSDIAKLSEQFRKNFSDTSQEAAFFDKLIAKTTQLSAAAKQYLDDRITNTREAISVEFQEDQIGEELVSGFGRMEHAQEQINATLAAGVAEWRLMAEQAQGVLKAQKDIKEFQEALNAGSTPSGQIKDLEDRLDTLQKQTMSVAGGKVVSRMSPDADLNITDDQKDRAIRAILGEAGGEGPLGELAVANVERNRLVSGRYGDSLSSVLTPGAFNALQPNDPTGALAASPSSLAYARAKAAYEKVFEDKDSAFLAGVGDDADKDPTHGATHYLNPATATDRSWIDTMTNVTTIGRHKFGNTPDSPPVLSDDDEKKRREAIQQTSQDLQQQKDILAGGTAEQRSQLQLAQQRATSDVSEVQAAQAKLDAAQKQLGAYGQIVKDGKVITEDESKATNATRTANETAYASAVAALRTAKEKQAIDQASAKAELDMGKATAAGNVSDVQAARMRLDAAQKQLAITGQSVSANGQVQTDAGKGNVASEDQRKKAAQDYYEAVAAMRTADAAQEKAVSDLKVAQAQEGSKARLNEQLAEIARRQAAAQGDVAKTAEIEKEKVEVTRAYNREQSAAAVETENAAYDAAQRRFALERDQINESARLGEISNLTKEQQLDASYARQIASTQAHYAKVRSIQQQYDAGSPAGDTKLAQAQAVAEDKLNEDRVKSAQQANNSIVESYKSSVESIGSTVATSLEGMLERTQKFDELLRNVARNIAGQFLQAGLKMVADWAVNQTKTVAIAVATQAQHAAAVVTGQAAQTGAVAAGTSAQTGLISTASIAQAAATAAGVLRSIFAYAAQAAAGVTAFMSSILGPAALGVGAGVEAAVIAMGTAIPSLAVGAWQLPSDTLAQLHAGEMVVPASPAQAFRDAMAGNGGGSSTTTINHHNYGDLHVNALDSFSVERWARSNGNAFMRGLATASHYGAALKIG